MIDTDIENYVKRCNPCQLSQARPLKSSIHHWDISAMPWHRIHLGYKGPVQGKMFLVVIDSYSKWMEIFPTNSTTSAVTIHFLKSLFVQFGLPYTTVTDNATNFTNEEFTDFCKTLEIQHRKVAPYHPASNGQAECTVQNLKRVLDKSDFENVLLDDALLKFLFSYRISPHSTTGFSPAELMFSRKLCCRLDFVFPDSSRE